MPPDTSILCPLTHRFSSERSAAIIGPISSGTPARPKAVISRHTLIDSGIVTHHPAAEVGLNRARCDDIRGDPAWTEFLGQIPGQHLDRSLRGSVGGTPGQSKSRES